MRNVLLLPLTMHLELADRALRLGDIERVQALLAVMARLVSDGEAAVIRLLQFAQPADGALARESVDPGDVVRRAVEIASAHAASRSASVTITVELAAVRAFEVDAAEVVAALVNLMVNAIEAGGSRIVVCTGCDADATWCDVTDDGPGIPATVRDRLFEPFVSTKSTAGSGLGLAMVDACMSRHGGRIEVDNPDAGGTRFRLYFPLV